MSYRDRLHRMSGTDLHLPNLIISRFRGIRDLSIERLGRVTLIAGKNGVGKTTVLDAVRLYAARGQLAVLTSILGMREEFARVAADDDEEALAPDWEALFYGRRALPQDPIVISPTGSPEWLRIAATPFNEAETSRWGPFLPEQFLAEDARMLRVTFAGREQATPFYASRTPSLHGAMVTEAKSELPPGMRSVSLGPNVLRNAEIARLWDKVALTHLEYRAVEALGLVYDNTIERAAVVGDESKTRFGRRAVVKMAGQERPVPLRSLGDGAVRLFGVALALANSQGGFLLIDEAENGIHYSLQRDFWRMVLLTAQANNVQVFATTHSWDCMAGFAQAAVDAADVEGALVRLERDGENTRAVTYPEEELLAAADHGIEVR